MRIITEEILEWVARCNNLWRQTLVWREKEEDVQDQLLRTLVISGLDSATPIEEIFKLIRVSYPVTMRTTRQLCRQQRAGNIFCLPKEVLLDSNIMYSLVTIDPFGRMMDGSPYTEVLYDGDAWILEPTQNLRYIIP